MGGDELVNITTLFGRDGRCEVGPLPGRQSCWPDGASFSEGVESSRGPTGDEMDSIGAKLIIQLQRRQVTESLARESTCRRLQSQPALLQSSVHAIIIFVE